MIGNRNDGARGIINPDSRNSRESRVFSYLLSLEKAFGNTGAFIVGFTCVVFIRSILEGLLEYEHLLGIRAVPAVSQAMLFLHFPVFYAAVFLLILIIITRLTGYGIRPVSNIMLRWWPLLLLPPVFDWIISSGKGYHLGYIFKSRDIIHALWKFWLPVSLDIEGVTPGMRLEISIACIGVGLYIALRRNVWRGIAGFFATFVSLLLLGSIPALIVSAGLDGNWITAGGFGNLQSHRFAIIYGIATGIFGLILLYRYDTVFTNAWFRCFRWLRSCMYILLPALGFWALYWVFKPWLDYVLLKPGDWISVIGIILSQVFSFQSAALFNDMADEPWDRSNNRNRLFLTYGIRRSRVKALAWVLFGFGVFFALCVQYAVFLIVLVQHFIAWVYSFPPWRLKKIPGVSTLLISTAAVLSFIAGGAVIGREWVFAIMPQGLSLALLVSFFLGFGFKDMADKDDDKRAGVRSIPVIIGIQRGRFFYTLSIVIAVITFPLISGLSILLMPAIACAVLCAVLILRSGVSCERSLIIILLISLVSVGIAIRFDRHWLTIQRERLTVCMNVESKLTTDKPDAPGARTWRTVPVFEDELVSNGADLLGAYPWIIPRLCAAIGPERGGKLLNRAARAGVCPGVAFVASLDCFAASDEPKLWRDALDGALMWNALSPELCAVSGRQADAFGFVETSARILTYGREKWPTNPAIWAETARFLLKRDRREEALHALRMAHRNDPGSTELQMDITRIETMLLHQRNKDDEYKRSMQ